MEKLQELFSSIFCPEGEGSSSVPSKIVFGGKRKKSLEYSRVTMRPLMLGGKLAYQAEYTYPKKVTHANLEPSEACSLALKLVSEDFKQVNIFTMSEEIQVLTAKPENPRITSKKISPAVSDAGRTTAWSSVKISDSDFEKILSLSYAAMLLSVACCM